MNYKKKLIEVALPLEAINRESAREKSIRHGHPSTLHLWWSRKPLATCRAVLFAALVDDPSSHPDRFPTEADQEKERKRLFGIIEELVKWENTNNEEVLEKARKEIMKATNNNPPPVYDPFCGGGSIPLEAQRLGLAAYASDLNPVAVLITKALIEIPPRFAGRPPVNHEARRQIGAGQGWQGAAGLAADVRYYGEWMRREAAKRIGHLYPKVKLPPEHGGGEATVIAWLWARTVRCPNPACGWEMPLASKFWLSTKKGKEAWVEPVVDGAVKQVRFVVKTGQGKPPRPPKVSRGAKFKCLCCGQIAPDQHIKDEGMAKRMGAQLMAIVAEGPSGRVYLDPSYEHIAVAQSATPEWGPEEELPYEPRAIWCTLYGLKQYKDLFTPRQLVALTTFSDLVAAAREQVYQDAVAAGMADDGTRLNDGGAGAAAYADAVATYLALAVDRLADYLSSICSWVIDRDTIRNTFARQAIPMTWDFAEANPLSGSTGNFYGAVRWVAGVLDQLAGNAPGAVYQKDATAGGLSCSVIISTDPPYYDNIGYADLSDFFYVWLRRALHGVYPDIFSTMLVPKAPELVATPYRFGGDKDKAKTFFEQGLGAAFAAMRQMANPDYPLTVYYAFKQSDTEAGDDGAENHGSTASTGWETMLEGLLQAGFVITGTWPMRSERSGRMISIGANALASSIVLVCRPRPDDAPLATRREFLSALRRELPQALHELQQGNIAPVDMAQCAIGPGMAIFSRYKRVLEADGQPMPVRTALALINQELDAYLAAQEGAMDEDTRFCAAWFEQFGLGEAPFGEADVLARAKNTAVDRLVSDGILAAAKGKVRLLKRDELADFSPEHDSRLTVWRSAQQLVKALLEGGEDAAARLALRLGGERAEQAKALAYRLYTICERRGWADEALAYNTLVVSWPAIQQKMAEFAARPAVQVELSL